jgi:transposase
MSVPGFGPLRSAQAIVAIKTPMRFRRARHLWAYAGLSVVMHTSADYELKDGGLERRQRRASTRGLVRSCNWQLKAVFKGAAETAIRSSLKPLQRLVAPGSSRRSRTW